MKIYLHFLMSQTFESFQNDGKHSMRKLATPPRMYVTQGILALIILGVLMAFTPCFQPSGMDPNSEPRFSDIRIVELQVNTKPSQGVKIHHVPRDETSTFNY